MGSVRLTLRVAVPTGCRVRLWVNLGSQVAAAHFAPGVRQPGSNVCIANMQKKMVCVLCKFWRWYHYGPVSFCTSCTAHIGVLVVILTALWSVTCSCQMMPLAVWDVSVACRMPHVRCITMNVRCAHLGHGRESRVISAEGIKVHFLFLHRSLTVLPLHGYLLYLPVSCTL